MGAVGGIFGLSLPAAGTNLNMTQFSIRGNTAPALQPTEPPEGSTKDVQDVAETERWEEEGAADGTAGGAVDEAGSEAAPHGPFLVRSRSADPQELPLTIEQSMMELKRDLWGRPGSTF